MYIIYLYTIHIYVYTSRTPERVDYIIKCIYIYTCVCVWADKYIHIYTYVSVRLRGVKGEG